LGVWNLFFILQGLTAKSLPWVSEETLNLNFWTMLELLRLWELLKIESMHFALWDGNESFGGQEKMLCFV
jgi:hypothetical protein